MTVDNSPKPTLVFPSKNAGTRSIALGCTRPSFAVIDQSLVVDNRVSSENLGSIYSYTILEESIGPSKELRSSKIGLKNYLTYIPNDTRTTLVRARRSLDPRNPSADPAWNDVERVQAFANQLFNSRHTLLNTRGALVGERGKVIWRALVDWEFSVEELCDALKIAAGDGWWKSRGITDTTKLLRKEEHIRGWLELAQSGRRPRAEAYDKRQLELGAKSGARPDPRTLGGELF